MAQDPRNLVHSRVQHGNNFRCVYSCGNWYILMFFEIADFVEIKIMTLNGIELETSDLEINLKQIDEKVILHFEFAHVNAFLNCNLFV